MAQARKDNNGVNTLIGTLDTDGLTPTLVKASPTTHRLNIDDASTGSDNGQVLSRRDENSVTTIMAVSSVDGVTPVVIYVNNSGELLIDSN